MELDDTDGGPRWALVPDAWSLRLGMRAGRSVPLPWNRALGAYVAWERVEVDYAVPALLHLGVLAVRAGHELTQHRPRRVQLPPADSQHGGGA